MRLPKNHIIQINNFRWKSFIMSTLLSTFIGMNPNLPPPSNPTGKGIMPAMAAIPPSSNLSSMYGVQQPPNSTMHSMGHTAENNFGVHPEVSVHDLANYLLPKFRNAESSNNYNADRSLTHPGQTASGGYQYLDPTWNNYKGYKRAVHAPPEVQDERMHNDLVQNLQKFGGDPFKTVASHYFPRYANDPAKWTQPLVDQNGKELKGTPTVKDYVGSILPKERVEQYLAQFQPASPTG